MKINMLPNSIKKYVNNKPFTVDKIGESDSQVIIFDDMVLKIEKTGNQSDREYDALKWLSDKLPVPKIVAFDKADGFNYLLMTRIKEKNLIDDIYSIEPKQIIEALADGLKQLWSIDISTCPLQSRLPSRLAEAKYRIDNGLVDVDDFNEDTLGENGFADIEELFSFLLENQPEEDLVFTNGDYCLPNFFINQNRIVGFIDLGKAGVADRWQDLALCIRSIEYNLCEIKNLSHSYFLEWRDYLLELLDVKLDNIKLRYYILLDELF